MHSIQLDVVHSAEKLQSVLKAADQAAEAAKSIIFDEGFNDRKGWKLDSENEHVVVHYKDINGKRHFAAQTIVPISTEIGASLNWEHVEKMADWNSNVKFSKLVGRIGDDVDLAHYASNEVFMVKSREFVVARKLLHFGDTCIVAAQSCSTELVETTGKAVMGFLNLGVGRYIPHDVNHKHSRYDYIVSMDLNGMMPTYLVNQVMGKMVLSDVDNHRKNAENFSKQIS